MSSSPLRLGFLASGGGSSARAIAEAAARGEMAAEVRLLVSNTAKAPALDWARAMGVPTSCIPTAGDADAADARLTEAMQAHGVELIVLSGYLRLLGPRLLARYENRVLNIHPGPLPEFGGHGMYGRRVHEAVVAAGRNESAATIHIVDGRYDEGPVLARNPVAILPGDTAEALEARVKASEPPFFVETLKLIARGELPLP